jgi:hypothetical protein
MKATTSPTEKAFDSIMESELFRLNGPAIDLCGSIIDLCNAIQAEKETNWSLGEFGECSLDSFLVGAYWALTEWHGGQASDSYAALCAIGSIFSPGMSGPPTEEDSEWTAYEAVNDWFNSQSVKP